ncbi:MAG: hypothetical protein IPM81_18610 [Saprospirales bacterium]|nr:hypothetical protein [Saprospirales bacterium]
MTAVVSLLLLAACQKNNTTELRRTRYITPVPCTRRSRNRNPAPARSAHGFGTRGNAFPEKGTGIHLNAEQIRLANILTDTVHLRPVGEEITLAATLRENQAAINTMTAKVAGRIERLCATR